MPSYTPLEHQARAFAAQIRPLVDDDHAFCPTCFMAFAEQLDFAAREHLGMKCPEFYDTLMAFVTTEHILDMDLRIAQSTYLLSHQIMKCVKCSAQPTSNDEINYFIPVDDMPFDKIYNTCCYILASCLAPPDPSTGQLPKRIQKWPFKAGHWPSTPDQLFPLGPERTIDHLVHSAYHRGAVNLLSAMLQRHRPRVFEEITKVENNDFLLRATIRGFEAAARLAAATLSTHNESIGRPSAAPTPASDEAVVEALEIYDPFTTLLVTILAGVDSQPHELARFAFCYDHVLYRAVVSVLAHVSDAEKCNPPLAKVAIALYQKLDVVHRRDPPPPFIRVEVEEDLKAQVDVYRLLGGVLPLFFLRRACTWPACGKQPHTRTGSTAFAKCASCRAVQYCSRDCQRADWREEHREICDILKEVFTILPKAEIPDLPRHEIAQVCRDHALPPDRARRLATWILGYSSEETPLRTQGLSITSSM
ncbi:hypothetical protein EXIGLDRAFT_832250 [Exidia glandulosa HHB12029]|uniref:MYND-type domain-containing protein n=1 Tax=Exidia glandulosa HHB12029 TaxID=1314781 RepID=A0A165LTX0_EXIGL|nr:hypothetical protein EXIGLDRAFT_832250 [Exidia glandulosa HHB12029]